MVLAGVREMGQLVSVQDQPGAVRASYFDPFCEAPREVTVAGAEDLDELIQSVIAVKTGRGHPALELTRTDGSILSLATDGVVAFLVWTDS